MNFASKIKQIERIDNLIRMKNTGSPMELSERLNISERQLYNIIGLMKEMGAPIYYSDIKRSYCYHNEGRFTFGFLIADNQLDKLVGGNSNSSYLDYFQSGNKISNQITTEILFQW